MTIDLAHWIVAGVLGISWLVLLIKPWQSKEDRLKKNLAIVDAEEGQDA